jgi:hypothetical protein
MKTLAEIAIEAGLVTKANAAKAGHLAEDKKQPLVVALVRELGVDELALVAALRKHTRVPLADPGDVTIDPEALRQVPRDVCARLRVLPIGSAIDGTSRVLRVAMADPTDTTAIAELESLAHCDIDVVALPLSAIDELIGKAYRQVNTAVVQRPGARRFGDNLFVTAKGRGVPATDESEISVTAQIPLAMLHAAVPDELELRLTALVQVLVAKGIFTEDELAEALRKARPAPAGGADPDPTGGDTAGTPGSGNDGAG